MVVRSLHLALWADARRWRMVVRAILVDIVKACQVDHCERNDSLRYRSLMGGTGGAAEIQAWNEMPRMKPVMHLA